MSVQTAHNQSYFESRILVVDDAALNRELIVRYLSNAGFKNLEVAVDGEDALEKVKEFDPELIILDLVMPKMDGFQVIKSLRQQERHLNLPIIVQTSISDPEQRVDAWDVGATDIITKPIHKIELVSRVRVQLENSFLIKQLSNYQFSTQMDIQQALEVQRSLLPTHDDIEELERDKNLSLDYLFIPSRHLSGDIWGMINNKDRELVVWIADFTGKGIRAALNTFRLHTLIQEFQTLAHQPKAFLEVLNISMCDLLPTGQFVTFLAGVIDKENEVIRYAAASSTHPLVYNPKTKSCIAGDGTGLPLGIDKSFEFKETTIPFPKGSSLILYSDMLWEDEGIPGVSLLPEKVDEFVREIDGRNLVDVVKEQIKLVGDISLPDDLTLIEVRHNE